MQHLIAALDTLIDAGVEAIVAGFDGATDAQVAMRVKGAELRQRVATADLLGPALSKLAHQLIAEVERRTLPRYAAILRSVRYNKDADINELEDARRTMNAAVLAAGERPDPLQRFFVMTAIIRVRAITAVIGPDCIAEPLSTRQTASGPLPRRREIGPSDMSPEVARIVVDMVYDRAAWIKGLADLTALETGEANVVGLVSSLIALAEQPRGDAYLRTIALRIKRAGLDTTISDGAGDESVSGIATAEEQTPLDVVAREIARSVSTLVAAAPSGSLASDNRTARMRRLSDHLAQSANPRALLNARRAQNAKPPESAS